MRPGKPPLPLNINNLEIFGFPAYLPYYDKYLLGNSDHHGKSGTDRRVSNAFWKHPYAYAPYRLMTRDGEIEEIPYPEIIFDFGLKGFQYLWPTPHGLLIETSGGKPTYPLPFDGLLLLQGERLLRLWGGSGWFTRGAREITHVLNISPDGCHVVLTHSDMRTYPGNHPLSILNICKEQ